MRGIGGAGAAGRPVAPVSDLCRLLHVGHFLGGLRPGHAGRDVESRHLRPQRDRPEDLGDPLVVEPVPAAQVARRCRAGTRRSGISLLENLVDMLAGIALLDLGKNCHGAPVMCRVLDRLRLHRIGRHVTCAVTQVTVESVQPMQPSRRRGSADALPVASCPGMRRALTKPRRPAPATTTQRAGQ